MKNRIRVERAERGISQADLAEILGVSRQTIHSIEAEKYIPSTLLALKMAKYFQKDVSRIFILEED